MTRFRSIVRATVVALALPSFFTLISCEQEELREHPEVTATEDDGRAEDGVSDEIAEYRTRMEQQIDRLNEELELIDDRAADLSEDARMRYRETVDDLRAKRDELAAALDDLEVESRAAWAEMRVGLERSWDELKAGVSAAGDELGIGSDDPELPEN